MKMLFEMLAFLFLSWTGYCVDIQCSNGSDAEIEPRTIYICLVISKMGTEVIATQVDGVYNAQANLQNSLQFSYVSQSHPYHTLHLIESGRSSSGRIEGTEYAGGASIDLFSSYPNIVKGSTIEVPW